MTSGTTSPRIVTIGDATLYLGDCLTIFGGISSFTHVVTDPPYDEEAHTLQRRTLGAGVTRSRRLKNSALPFKSLSQHDRDIFCPSAVHKCAGWFIAFCQAESVGEWRQSLRQAGAKWRRAGVWVKPDSSPQLSGDRPACGHEAIALAWCGRGRSVWSGGGSRAVWTIPKHDAGHGHGGISNEHPTQKPLRLMRKLVSDFTQPGDVVCDPFMGAGTTGIACIELGRKFVGVEIDGSYFEIACRRIAAAHAQQKMDFRVHPQVTERLSLELAALKQDTPT